IEQIRTGEITTVVAGGCDLNGTFRAKRFPAERIAGKPAPEVEFSEAIWTMDLVDFPQPTPPGYEGTWPSWATGFGDVVAVADLTTLRRVPWLDRTALVLCDYRLADGSPSQIAPRNLLRRVLERYERLG